MLTNEGSIQYEHSMDHNLEFFSKAGSIFDNQIAFYNNKEDILKLFINSWIVDDKKLAFKLLMWLRDCRGGAGNRSGFLKCLKWLASKDDGAEWIKKNITLIPKYGRWGDLRVLFGTPCEKEAVCIWNEAILIGNELAAKWAKRKDIPLYLDLKKKRYVKNMGDFRRLLARKRKGTIVEEKMCAGEWDKIDYKTVPSKAMSMYSRAFDKHDSDRFDAYKEDLKNGKTKINTSVLFPHDCMHSSSDIAEQQFQNLPNYIGDNKSILTLADSSGSMKALITNNLSAYDVCISLCLYCSNNVPSDSPFYRKFIEFESESKFTSWENLTFVEATSIFNGAVGSTRIDRALDLILETGRMFNVKDEDMPGMLLILSDMQFSFGSLTNSTQIEHCLKKWDDAGYSRPKIVYWNLVPYYGDPAEKTDKNVALISGFSPAILTSILNCEDLTPMSVMLKVMEKYDDVLVP